MGHCTNIQTKNIFKNHRKAKQKKSSEGDYPNPPHPRKRKAILVRVNVIKNHASCVLSSICYQYVLWLKASRVVKQLYLHGFVFQKKRVTSFKSFVKEFFAFSNLLYNSAFSSSVLLLSSNCFLTKKIYSGKLSSPFFGSGLRALEVQIFHSLGRAYVYRGYGGAMFSGWNPKHFSPTDGFSFFTVRHVFVLFSHYMFTLSYFCVSNYQLAGKILFNP